MFGRKKLVDEISSLEYRLECVKSEANWRKWQAQERQKTIDSLLKKLNNGSDSDSVCLSERTYDGIRFVTKAYHEKKIKELESSEPEIKIVYRVPEKVPVYRVRVYKGDKYDEYDKVEKWRVDCVTASLNIYTLAGGLVVFPVESYDRFETEVTDRVYPDVDELNQD